MNILPPVHQTIASAGSDEKRLLIVFGCQRSGTSMFIQLFREDLDSKIYGERGLGLNGTHEMLPLPDIAELVAGNRAGLQVAKSLLESHRVAEILDYLPFSRAVWLYRDFHDVAASHQKRFPHKAMEHLRSVSDPGPGMSFAGEGASPETREIVTRALSGDLRRLDGDCLFWYTRNILFVEQALYGHERVRLCRYEDIVGSPAQSLRGVYDFVGRDYPGDFLVRKVHRRSVRKGAAIDVSPEVADLCQSLQQRLDSLLPGIS